MTEYRLADLCGNTIRQRTQAWIAVAHPEMRQELECAAYHLKYM